MSASTVTIWRCDRCEKEVTMPQREQPAQWHRLTKTSPPLASPNDVDKRDDWQLCRECSESVHDFMQMPVGRP